MLHGVCQTHRAPTFLAEHQAAEGRRLGSVRFASLRSTAKLQLPIDLLPQLLIDNAVVFARIDRVFVRNRAGVKDVRQQQP